MLRELLCPWCKPRQSLPPSTAPDHGTPAEVRPGQDDSCPCGAKWVAYDAALGGFSRREMEEQFCREFLAAAPGACEVRWETLMGADPVVEVLWGRRVG